MLRKASSNGTGTSLHRGWRREKAPLVRCTDRRCQGFGSQSGILDEDSGFFVGWGVDWDFDLDASFSAEELNAAETGCLLVQGGSWAPNR